jgi:hypothetical protein
VAGAGGRHKALRVVGGRKQPLALRERDQVVVRPVDHKERARAAADLRRAVEAVAHQGPRRQDRVEALHHGGDGRERADQGQRPVRAAARQIDSHRAAQRAAEEQHVPGGHALRQPVVGRVRGGVAARLAGAPGAAAVARVVEDEHGHAHLALPAGQCLRAEFEAEVAGPAVADQHGPARPAAGEPAAVEGRAVGGLESDVLHLELARRLGPAPRCRGRVEQQSVLQRHQDQEGHAVAQRQDKQAAEGEPLSPRKGRPRWRGR